VNVFPKASSAMVSARATNAETTVNLRRKGSGLVKRYWREIPMLLATSWKLWETSRRNWLINGAATARRRTVQKNTASASTLA